MTRNPRVRVARHWRRLLPGAILTLALATAQLLSARELSGQETRVLLVVGLGGDPAYRDTFHQWATDLRSAAVDHLGVAPDQITYLGERPEDAPDLIQGKSTKENIASALSRMAQEAGPRDRVLVVLIGHGSGQGQSVEFNLPGPDLSATELNAMLGAFTTQAVGVVNTSPSSGPFVQALSGPNRVVLTATRTAQERNETQFGGFFTEALESEDSDLNKDGRISLREAFEYATREVDRYYEERNLLATEHAQLDDDGDGVGSTELGEDASDGALAGTFWLGSGSGAATAGVVPDSISDPELLRLYQEKAELELRVQELRALRGQMEESRYEAELEKLLVDLALKNREIREKGGGEG